MAESPAVRLPIAVRMAEMGLAAAMGNLAMPYTLRANCCSGGCGGGSVPAGSGAAVAVAAALVVAPLELDAANRSSSGVEAELGEALLDEGALLDEPFFLTAFLAFFLIPLRSLVLPSTVVADLFWRARRRTSPGVKERPTPSSTAPSVLDEDDEEDEDDEAAATAAVNSSWAATACKRGLSLITGELAAGALAGLGVAGTSRVKWPSVTNFGDRLRRERGNDVGGSWEVGGNSGASGGDE